MLGMGRECTNLRRHLLFSLKRFYKRSRNQRPDRSLLAFARADLAWWLKPYPFHYRMAFAFSILLYPQPHRLSLRIAFPEGGLRAYRVPSQQHQWVRFRLYTDDFRGLRDSINEGVVPIALPFGSSLSVLLACSISRCFKQRFTSVNLTTHPSPLSA